VTCHKEAGQFFLLTPKLLQQLDYHERMRVLVVCNGEWRAFLLLCPQSRSTASPALTARLSRCRQFPSGPRATPGASSSSARSSTTSSARRAPSLSERAFSVPRLSSRTPFVPFPLAGRSRPHRLCTNAICCTHLLSIHALFVRCARPPSRFLSLHAHARLN
jgi:hypothetical protein